MIRVTTILDTAFMLIGFLLGVICGLNASYPSWLAWIAGGLFGIGILGLLSRKI